MKDERYAAKSWLDRNYALWCEIQQLKARREVLFNDINGGVASYKPKETQADAAKAQARVEDMRLSYSELCDLIDRRVKELNHADMDTLEVIARLKNADERVILTAKHINHLTWRAIENTIHFSRASMFRYYGKALDKVYVEVFADMDEALKEIYGHRVEK